ncbi:fungal-specific transcription factor domain-containing protein [Lentinula aciculospora]|uniref:Fungal-specific transcription factor domain-containing protein n=1 Tax=Lentinula aciculospora TaxID=153920 RepID=A0A9W9DNL9_9AGAR|nr:fungal-specific transcription factor domain-containing protein [Lentinula aciculospora]
MGSASTSRVPLVKNAYSAPALPVSTSKRKKLDDDELTGNSKKRNRVSFSCSECHRRKQKCDRQMPCSHCIARKVPELCKAYTPGKSDQDLNLRIARLEQIIEMALPQFSDLESSGFNFPERQRSMSMTEDDLHSQHEDHDASGGAFQSGKWYGNSASGSIAPASVLEQLENAVMQSKEASSNNTIHSVVPVLEPSAADNLKTLVQECGVSPHKIPEILQELPPLRTSDAYIDYYFTSLNWTRYAISEPEFRSAYAAVCAHGSHGLSATNPNDVRFLPLLFVVLAISARLAPEDLAGDARHRRITSLRYYWSSRRSLLIAAAIQPDSLDIVLTRLLSARFLTFDRRITECWSQLGAAVRTAEALGLHRDGASMGMEPAMVEYRRRIWSYLYHADRSYALVLGRPHSIQDDYTSTLPPSNIDDDSPAAFKQVPHPLSIPTRMTCIILRHQLASIIGRIVHHFQKVRTPSHYSEVCALDDDILRYVSNLPPHYSLNPDTSLDEEKPYIPVHRFLLITEVLFVRTSLHRPYILRRLSSDRYARSRAACFESAVKDYQVRQAFRETASEEVRISLGNAYREFQTAMISGIYLVIYPNGEDASAMHTILDTFVSDHDGLREIDETTRRELKTIEFLKSKSLERSQPDATLTASTTNGNSTNRSVTTPDNAAQLLLNIHRSPPAVGSPKAPFPSLFNLGTDYANSSATYPYNENAAVGATAHLTQSPTYQRLQHPAEYSPAASSSPAAEESESTAQILFDHWCNTVSNAPLERLNAPLAWGGQGGADLSGWAAQAAAGSSVQQLTGAVNGAVNGSDNQDWSFYWEALVNQIPQVMPQSSE